MSHISLFILRKTNNPDDCADLVALKTQIFLFFFCLKLVPDYCFYNNREQVQGKWAKLAERVKSGDFKGCFFFFSPLAAVYVDLLETDQSGPHFLSTCLAANHSSASLKKKKKKLFCVLAWSHTGGPGALGRSFNVQPACSSIYSHYKPHAGAVPTLETCKSRL